LRPVLFGTLAEFHQEVAGLLGRQPSARTPVAMTTAWDTTLRLTGALQ
jgi:hypothetical protein